jgi:hypothetical protein
VSTYTPIASVTLSSAQSSVTFSGIPQTYTDLVLVASCQTNAAGTDKDLYLRFNGDSANNYSRTRLVGNGSTATSARQSDVSQIVCGAMPGTSYTSEFAANVIQIQNYTNTTTNKTTLVRNSFSQIAVQAIVGLYRSTSAITSVTLIPESGSFVSGSTFNLYGVANASITNVAKATGGDSVTTDGTYWYHTFRSSGTFTPTQALTCDYLVVAGGGGGGANFGSGGGAGGLRCTVTATGGGGSLESALALTAQAYTVTIGAGGAAQTIDNVLGNPGSNSVFSTITASGGGAGAGAATAGGNGGSGGGAGGGTTARSGGTGTANQGYAGGSNAGGPDAGGAGGGGAGAVGSNTTGSATGGTGGAGVSTSISGTSTSYAGGGGGGNSGSASAGGGTGGASAGNGVAGTANTGGGGGGGGQYSGDGAAGGSGIVIVRYAV